MEYKRDVRTGRFVMIEPTVGRSDFQEEVATLNGVNIPNAAYCSAVGQPVPPPCPRPGRWAGPFRRSTGGRPRCSPGRNAVSRTACGRGMRRAGGWTIPCPGATRLWTVSDRGCRDCLRGPIGPARALFPGRRDVDIRAGFKRLLTEFLAELIVHKPMNVTESAAGARPRGPSRPALVRSRLRGGDRGLPGMARPGAGPVGDGGWRGRTPFQPDRRLGRVLSGDDRKHRLRHC